MAVADERDSAAPAPCAPCRGAGQLLSQLGGTPAQVVCPWCEGSGTQIPGHDAQAARLAAGAPR
jgi:DnaJ-class molecular chaperone